jgi:hypothetical protein
MAIPVISSSRRIRWKSTAIEQEIRRNCRHECLTSPAAPHIMSEYGYIVERRRTGGVGSRPSPESEGHRVRALTDASTAEGRRGVGLLKGRCPQHSQILSLTCLTRMYPPSGNPGFARYSREWASGMAPGCQARWYRGSALSSLSSGAFYFQGDGSSLPALLADCGTIGAL